MGRVNRSVKLPPELWKWIEERVRHGQLNHRDPVPSVNAWVERAILRDRDHVERSRRKKRLPVRENRLEGGGSPM